jgi:hypothetical protein
VTEFCRQVLSTRTSDIHHYAALRRPLTTSLHGRTILPFSTAANPLPPNRQPSRAAFYTILRCDGRTL